MVSRAKLLSCPKATMHHVVASVVDWCWDADAQTEMWKLNLVMTKQYGMHDSGHRDDGLRTAPTISDVSTVICTVWKRYCNGLSIWIPL